MDIRDANYWKNEIIETENKLAKLIKEEDFEIHTAKSDSDSVTYQSISDRVKALKSYIRYCEIKYQECITNKDIDSNSILYFNREFGC